MAKDSCWQAYSFPRHDLAQMKNTFMDRKDLDVLWLFGWPGPMQCTKCTTGPAQIEPNCNYGDFPPLKGVKTCQSIRAIALLACFLVLFWYVLASAFCRLWLR